MDGCKGGVIMFNEKESEYSVKQGKEIPVWKSPKYEEAKKKAVELIESKKYNLVEGDFWILMNETKSGKMMYTGLIISHNGCLKINDSLEESLKFKPSCVNLDKEGFDGSLVYTYINDEQCIYEVGEVSHNNCKNAYPYAMALKRCMDRVILKNCKLAYSGVYSDSEADEFAEPKEVKKDKITSSEVDMLKKMFEAKKVSDEDIQKTLEVFGANSLGELTQEQYGKILHRLKQK